MIKQGIYTNGFLYMLLAAFLVLGTSSCAVEKQPAQKSTVVTKSHPAHPHGGPPGQTKKSNGHPGKKH